MGGGGRDVNLGHADGFFAIVPNSKSEFVLQNRIRIFVFMKFKNSLCSFLLLVLKLLWRYLLK